eukprot:1145947-Pelagomonas_calceolata.AAC.2
MQGAQAHNQETTLPPRRTAKSMAATDWFRCGCLPSELSHWRPQMAYNQVIPEDSPSIRR